LVYQRGIYEKREHAVATSILEGKLTEKVTAIKLVCSSCYR
jgi:hypothetical protein